MPEITPKMLEIILGGILAILGASWVIKFVLSKNNNRVKQSNNTVHGDQAGRDINKNNGR